jgi:hypothetical protein
MKEGGNVKTTPNRPYSRLDAAITLKEKSNLMITSQRRSRSLRREHFMLAKSMPENSVRM